MGVHQIYYRIAGTPNYSFDGRQLPETAITAATAYDRLEVLQTAIDPGFHFDELRPHHDPSLTPHNLLHNSNWDWKALLWLLAAFLALVLWVRLIARYLEDDMNEFMSCLFDTPPQPREPKPDSEARDRAKDDEISGLKATVCALTTQLSEQSRSAAALNEQSCRRISQLERALTSDEQAKRIMRSQLDDQTEAIEKAAALNELCCQKIADLELETSNLRAETAQLLLASVPPTAESDEPQAPENDEKGFKAAEDDGADRPSSSPQPTPSVAPPNLPSPTGKQPASPKSEENKNSATEPSKSGSKDRTMIVEVCRFGHNCNSSSCRYAHQSPVGAPGVVTDPSSPCALKENCTDPICTGRHPSPSLKPPPGMSQRQWRKTLRERVYASKQ